VPQDSSEAIKIQLSGDSLRSGNSVRLKVFGMSMLPSVWPGDVLLIESDNKARAGDIVLCQTERGLTVHRLVASSGGGYIVTRGDGMNQADPCGEESQLLGRVVQIERNGKTIIPRRGLRSTTKTLAWLFSHSAHCRSVALRIHSVKSAHASKRGLASQSS
jgi:hypothetical protein